MEFLLMKFDGCREFYNSAEACQLGSGPTKIQKSGAGRELLEDPASGDEALVIGEGLGSPRRLEATPDHRERVDGFGQQQHLLGRAERDSLITNSHLATDN